MAGASHLVDGRLLDEAGGVAGQDAVRGHDVDLVGASFLQRLGRRHKAVHVVDDVVLGGRGGKRGERGSNEVESVQSAPPVKPDASMTDLWSIDSMIPAAVFRHSLVFASRGFKKKNKPSRILQCVQTRAARY